MANECIEVGSPNPDIGGVGLLLSFGIQALLTIIVSTISFGFMIIIYRLEGRQPEEQEPGFELQDPPPVSKYLNRTVETWYQLLRTTESLLQTNSDIQTMTGISLLVTALVQIKTLSFYHLHIVYDTVSFVAVSTSAAAASTLKAKTIAGIIRYFLIALWSILYVVFTSLFGKRLESWDYNSPGRCYNTTNLAHPSARHPYVDKIYLAFTCLYLLSGLMLAIAVGVEIQLTTKLTRLALAQVYALAIAFAQFPVHTYSVLTLRKSNEKLLSSGNGEQEWGFGQVSAMILLAPNLFGIIIAINDYNKWQRRQQNREHGDNQPGIAEGEVEVEGIEGGREEQV